MQLVYGEKPQRLDVIIPLEDEEVWASQYYRQYSRSRGLVCKGDGETCRRMVDTETGDVAGRDTKEVTWSEGGTCAGMECPDYKAKACQEVMNLQFLLPKVPGLGVWQVDTGSINSIRNINNCATMIRAMCGRVSWIPLLLTLEPTEVVNPDDGKKKTVYCMHLRYERSAESLLTDSEKPRLQLLLSAPADDEAPEDRHFSISTPEKKEEVQSKAEDDIHDLWPEPEEEPRMSKAEIKELEAESTPAPDAPQATREPSKTDAKVIPPVAELAEQVKEKLDKKENKDDQASPESVEALKALAEKAGKSMMDLGSLMSKELKWVVPKTLQELKVWQVKELTDILNTAIG
uniref:Uncharacterized protein n=1 Tax=viral metagenome TaxID=1070528 RepID=A0A6M3JNT6_9ZZZZ